jgi:hypothetical protein
MGSRGFFLGGKSAGGVKMTTHLHLVPRSGIGGAIPLILQYAFMAWCSIKAQGLYLTHIYAIT